MSDKVDREIRRIVIDWLQFGDSMDEPLAQNALTLISDLEKERDKAIQDMNLAVSNAGKDLIAERDRYKSALELICSMTMSVYVDKTHLIVALKNIAKSALQTHEKE